MSEDCPSCEEREMMREAIAAPLLRQAPPGSGWARFKEPPLMQAVHIPVKPGETRRHADYMLVLPELGVHFFVTTEQLNEYFTLEGSDGR